MDLLNNAKWLQEVEEAGGVHVTPETKVQHVDEKDFVDMLSSRDHTLRRHEDHERGLRGLFSTKENILYTTDATRLSAHSIVPAEQHNAVIESHPDVQTS